MDDIALTLYPLPSVSGSGSRQPRGSVVAEHPFCGVRCKRQCEAASATELDVCPYGVNYFRAGEVLVYGFCVSTDISPSNPVAQRKARSKATKKFHKAEIVAMRSALVRACLLADRQTQSEVSQAVDNAHDAGELAHAVVQEMQSELQRSLSQFHDFRALAGRAWRNLDVYMAKNFGGLAEEQLQKKAYELVSARYALDLMIDKIDLALLLIQPERIRSEIDAKNARFHGLVVKYIHIYRREAQEKGVRLSAVGESFSEIRGNMVALSAIPHTLIDNAVKYAPTGTHVQVEFGESEAEITFSVESIGPKIEKNERAKIYLPFFRGKHAVESEPTGMGFGLAASKLVADECGIRLTHSQEPSRGEGGYKTTFTAVFPISRKLRATGRS